MIDDDCSFIESKGYTNLEAGWHAVVAAMAARQRASIDRMLAATLPIGPGPEADALRAHYEA